MDQKVPDDAVGRRVSCDGGRGTVRYVGTVPPTAGLWLGVEWDNPERGKHNGSHGGVCYFTCRHPTGGSFVRPKKVSFGVDFLSAVKERYELELDQAISKETTLSTREVELVGFNSVLEEQQIKNLKWVALRFCEVSGPGASQEIKTNTPNVTLLDLMGNLLSSWEVVAAITEQLEQLQILCLSENRLTLSSNPSNFTHAFSCLRLLTLNSCAITWPQVLHCAPMWPHIEELIVVSNDITELQRPVDVLQNLKVLDLANNNLVQESLLELSHLPRLENLSLLNTGLSDIHFSDALPGSKTQSFPALKILNLADNNITEWGVINELEKLRALVRLFCRRNPLINSEKNMETSHQLIIARLSQLEILDGRTVTYEDRRGAELDYCRKFGRAWMQAGGHPNPAQNQPSAEFLTQHPRYLSLIQKYGAPDEEELKEQKPFSLKDQLLNITFEFPENADRKPIQRKLPGSMIVQKVKSLLSRLLKIPGAEIQLTYVSYKMKEKEIEIDNDLKTLEFYSVESGDRILVRWS